MESGTSINKVRAVARKIKPRMDRKIIFVRDGKEMMGAALDREALDKWLETNQPGIPE